MKHTLQRLLSGFLLILMIGVGPLSALTATAATTSSSSSADPVYTTLRTIDLGTFNEYRYKITEQFFVLREYFEVNDELDVKTLQNIAKLADTAYKYLPDNLKNQNYLRELLIDIQKGVKSPSNQILYTEVIKSLADYLEKVEVESIQGSIEATPLSGNAPLTSTFRAKVEDPSGTQIASGNYTWWIDSNGKKVVIGRGISLNYSFKEEGKYSVFLDVTSSHKNAEGYTDVLPLRQRVDINVNEKIASVIIKVNGDSVSDNKELKFTPETADYGLLFDATSSTPTSGTKFMRTEWDFGNGVRRSYTGSPQIERIRYAIQGEYSVRLKLTTNEGNVVVRDFTVSIRNPIATIEVNREDGYIGDSFTFSAKSAGNYKNLTYTWEILDIDKDKIVHQKNDQTFSYSFTQKGRYNVKLKVRRSSGEIDQDTRIVYVTSQSPVAEFETSIPLSHKPNRVFFDASRSFDPDVMDDGNLKYNWFIDGNRINLEQSSGNGSLGYYVFDTLGTHSVSLEVTDPEGITATKKSDIVIDSLLSVEMFALPRVIQRNGTIKFVAQSPEAEVYEWNFGDGKTSGGTQDSVTHSYETSGSFSVTVKVSDKDNKTNTYTRQVYVSDSDEPYALIDVKQDTTENIRFDAQACNGKGAYVASRAQNLNFDAAESININGETTGLDYSWKIGQTKYATSSSVIHRFDEIGCFPVKLTVTSQSNGKSHTSDTLVDVQNMLPTLASLTVQVENPDVDPLVVRVNAVGATDPDGIIQSYLWYYYTDIDTTPQDFRSTASPSTAFVIPKVTGNYYFVAILKDNNEARVTSEEITGSRYFTTITGDNINTPIVELSVTDTSTVIGEEVTFTAKASNILGQGLEKDAEFSWDFDGDGFYDTQTKTPSTSYVYKKSGEFYAKVKVKYRGISSTRNITMNVSNKLVADFDYISIGNTFIFFDSSSGQVESREWDLGDGTKKTESSFEYTYDDKDPSHTVKLKITEGTSVKEIEKTVSKNFKNILKSREGGLVVFSSPAVDENGKIVLENASQKVFVYMGESDEKAESFAIDYDSEQDSDLNGGTDDDENNKGTASYIAGSVIEIPLSPYKTQKVRLFLKDAAGTVIDSQDMILEKTYIEEENINPDTIIFEGVTESEKQKIDALKAILIELPQQQRLKALSYVQKLQENWSDATEKTRTILDFEAYIFELKLKNENDVIGLLESLLVEGQEDQSVKQITYQALVNLIPKDIVCTSTAATCYESMIQKLDAIKNSDDVEANKVIGKEILEVVGGSELLTTQQKLDVKALLASLVYGGDVTAMPEDEKQQIIAETPTQSNEDNSALMGILFTILKWIGYILLAFVLVVAGFYLYYLIFNKDKSIGFADFITRKTSLESQNGQSGEGSGQDILAEFLEESPSVTAASSTETVKIEKDPLSTTSSAPEEVPDWLKGTFSSAKEVSPEAPVVLEKASVPEIIAPLPEEKLPEPIQGEAFSTVTPEVPEASVLPETSVPDWLKGSFDETPVVASVETPVVNAEIPLETPLISVVPSLETPVVSPLPEVKNEETLQVPDWLKGSLDVIPVVSQTAEVIPEKIPELEVAAETPKKAPKKAKSEESVKAPETPKKAPKKAKASEDTPKKEELWDDGMKIPDWLKSDDES